MAYTSIELVRPPHFGLQLVDADLTRSLKLSNAGKVESATNNSTLINNKRAAYCYKVNRQGLGFTTSKGDQLDSVFRVLHL